MMTSRIEITAVSGLPEVAEGDDLAALIHAAAEAQETPIAGDDVVVVAQKIVSKAEGAVVDLGGVIPSERARELAELVGKDPRLVEVILGQTRRIVRAVPGVLIVETIHGLVCANAGVDQSNVPGNGGALTLPRDPDASARRLRAGLEARAGSRVAVIVSDSFNRPWRTGSVNVAIGTAGFQPLRDSRSRTDDHGRPLRATVVSLADELASAAQLVMGEFGGTPAAIVRGAGVEPADGVDSVVLRRDPARDLFR